MSWNTKTLWTMVVVVLLCLSLAQAQQTYTEEFTGEANGWITLPTNVNLVSNTFQTTYCDAALWIYPVGEISGDFIFEADATILTRYNESGGADHIALGVHIPWDPVTCQLTSSNYYQFFLRQGTLDDVYLYDASGAPFLDHTNYSLSPIQGTHHYKIERIGNTFNCYIDDQQLLTWTGTSPYSGGYVGIFGGQGYTFSGTVPSIQFDHVAFTSGTTYTEDFTSDANGWVGGYPMGCDVANNTFVSYYCEMALWMYPLGEIDDDFRFEADATIVTRYNGPGGADHVVLLLHVPWDPETCQLTSNNFYQFTLRQGTLDDVYLNDAAGGPFLDWQNYNLDPIQGTHHYKVVRIGNTFTCFIDDQQVLTWTGVSPYSGGYLGIEGAQGYSYSGTPPSIVWDNVEVTTRTTAVSETPEILRTFSLNQNYPNPFNPVTNLSFSLPVTSKVNLIVYDVNGRQVSQLVDNRYNAGVYNVLFDGSGLSSGVYFYHLQAGEFTAVNKMVLLK